MAKLERSEKLEVILNAITHKANLIKMQTEKPPQAVTIKRQAIEIMSLSEMGGELI